MFGDFDFKESRRMPDPIQSPVDMMIHVSHLGAKPQLLVSRRKSEGRTHEDW